MKYIFENLAEIVDRLKKSIVMIFLDYDGTLVPLAETPELATCPEPTKKILQKLSRNNNCSVSIVSGRSILSLRQMIDIEGITLVGNHGIEILNNEKYNSIYKRKLISVKKNVSEAVIEISQIIKDFNGSMLENKEYSISVHYRLVPEKEVSKLKKLVLSVFKKFTTSGELQICEGKKVIELRPLDLVTKATAVLWLYNNAKNITQNSVMPIYIGDDKTDEDVFKAIKNFGITILVGKKNKKSSASYYVKDSHETIKLLHKLENI